MRFQTLDSSTAMRTATLATLAIAIALALLVVSSFSPGGANAHPLGNLSVSRYSRLELYSDATLIRYVVDIAEVPAFQELRSIDTDGDGEPSAAEGSAYLEELAPALRNELHLEVDGSEVDLRLMSSDIAFPEGQAGLRTIRAGLWLRADIDGELVRLEYRDGNYADRTGWREIVVVSGEGVELVSSSAPAEDLSAELTAYPTDRIADQPGLTVAAASYVAGTGESAPVTGLGTVSLEPSVQSGGFASLIGRDKLTLSVVLVSVLAALGFGAIHALEPGHGKTLVAAYFAGVRGTVKQALTLGLIIAATHSLGVMAIGLLVLFGSHFILPEDLYPWLTLFAGLIVLSLGLRLAAQRIPSLLRRRSNLHAHGHSHEHPEAAGGSPWRNLVLIGLVDGIVPSPSTILVLLAAVSLDRIVLGAALIVAFSVGLAAVLTAVSLSLVYAQRFLKRLNDTLGSRSSGPIGSVIASVSGEGVVARALPSCAAVMLVAVGTFLTLSAATGPGTPF